MNASTASALLAQRAEAVCRQYLPQGKKQGRYWCAGDARGARGRSLFVRLGPPGTPGKWTDAATGEHGDLLDLIRLATGCASLRETLAEARRFLAQPAAPGNGSDPIGTPTIMCAPRAISGAAAAPSTARTPKPT